MTASKQKPYLKNDDLIQIGFKKIPTFTIGNNVTFDLGRNRQLSASSIGTCNEFLAICEIDDENPKKINEIIVLHNYDYDGALSMEKITGIIESITGKKIAECQNKTSES